MQNTSRPVRALVVGATIALTGGLLSAIPAASASAPSTPAAHRTSSADGVAVHTVDNVRTNARGTSDYWTPQRRAAAQPAFADVKPSGLENQIPMPAGEQVAPGTGSKPVTGSAEPAARGVRDKYRIRVGKLFYKFGKKDWVCSASVVNSKRKNLVFTAAHCLWDKKKGWAHNIEFIPGYRKGKAPYGVWMGKRVAISPKFMRKSHGTKESIYNDYAVMTVKNRQKSGPNKVAKVVGAYGIQWGQKLSRKMIATGYPAFKTQGKKQRSCKGRTHLFKKFPHKTRRGTAILKMTCTAVTGGSSGGPWLHNDFINGQNAGVNSFKDPHWIATPWFAQGVKRVYGKLA